MAGMRRQSLTFYKRLQERVQEQSALHLCKFEIQRGHFCINYGPYCTLRKNILIYHYCVNLHKVHHIINIEVSLLFIAHTKQYHACRQVLSILSAVRSTHVLISRCNSMATDLEIISLSSRQEWLTLLPQQTDFFTAFKIHAKHIQMVVFLKKPPRVKLHVLQECTLIIQIFNYSYNDMKPNALPPYLSVKKRSSRSTRSECNP